MRQSLSELVVQTSGAGFTRISAAIDAEITKSNLNCGLASLLVRHTSCSLTINENADPRVLHDLEAFLRDLVPQERDYLHDDEGPDDMPAHIRTALTTTSLALPFSNGKLLLGTWQEIYLWEHRSRAHRRTIACHLLGE